jgi:hypothetical protein
LSELQALLERINRVVKPSEEPPKVSADLNTLLEHVELRKWRDYKLQETIERLCGLHDELDFIRHIRKCGNCQLELALDVIRYAGSHSGLWFLDLSNDDILPEIYEDCPKAGTYDMGSYWTRENYKEAIRFILDRAKWAEPKIREELYTAIDFYLALENWNLQSPLPSETSDEQLFAWGIL